MWNTTHLQLFFGICRLLVVRVALALLTRGSRQLLHLFGNFGRDELAQVGRTVDFPGYGGSNADVACRCTGGGGGFLLFGLPQCLAGECPCN